MSIGNTRDSGNKGTNFPFQKSVLLMLGRILNTLSAVTPDTLIIPVVGVNSDQLLGAVPAGYMLEVAIFQEVGGISGATLQLGPISGSGTIMPGTAIAVNGIETISLNYFPGTTIYPVFVSAPLGFTTSVFKIWLVLKKII